MGLPQYPFPVAVLHQVVLLQEELVEKVDNLCRSFIVEDQAYLINNYIRSLMRCRQSHLNFYMNFFTARSTSLNNKLLNKTHVLKLLHLHLKVERAHSAE